MIKRFNTLRGRFALWTAGLIFVILSLFGTFVYANMARGLQTELDASLTLNASQVSIGLDDKANLTISETFLDEPENANLLARGFLLRVVNPQREIVQEFGNYRDLPLPENLSNTSFFSTVVLPGNDTPVRVYTMPILEQGQLVGYVQVAQTMSEIQTTLRRLLTTLLISIPVLVLVAGGGGYLLAARSLAPIDQITRTARHISAEDLDARLNLPSTDDEVGRLAETFDEMLSRLDAAFQRERQFTSDASHELRTPLTSMQAILGMIRENRRSPEEYEQALDDLAEETDRLRTLTEKLLRLARGSARKNTHEPIDLSTLLLDVTDSLTPLAETKSLTLRQDIHDGLTLVGDRDDLIRLFVNLLDNAIHYTESGYITVIARQDQGQIEVTITDTGIGIPTEHLPHIFDRFYRVDQARTTGGAGLGLALAAEIARAHGGKIEVTSQVGEGTRFAVHLPSSDS